jgi:DUF4097 and DUF4098 domain-containing protein YvlB
MLAVMLLAGAGSAAAQGTQDFRWSGAVPAGQWVEVKGVNGDVRAEPARGSEVEVTAVRRAGERGRVEDVRIETVRHDGGITFCAIYPSRRGQPENRCTPGERWSTNTENNDATVEFVVRVPRGVHFRGQTVNGEVQAERMPANALVSTVNGGVRVSAAGVVEATTVNGAIEATTGSANPGRDLDFRTVNGDIELRVPADFRARVRAKLLNGSVSSDFPLNITRGRYVGARAEGEIGTGGRALGLETVNGSIRIRRAGSE